MRGVFLTLLVITMIVTGASAQSGKIPKFSRYPAAVEKARAKSINFKDNPDARTFRTRLTEALRGGVNFAGHYIVAGWGCGTGCVSGAIIDARTGDVYWPEQFNAIGVWYGEGSHGDKPIEHRKDSRLLIIHGIPGNKKGDDADKPSGDYYYEWRGNRLVQVWFGSNPMETNGQ